MEYNFRAIEKEWQKRWKETDAYKVPNDFSKPKYYVLDMFPYPSGAGLHVGHPLGYIASDIFARYKRLKGFNVLHPMGYDAFGLPAEQYAIDHGIHPAVSTENNINTFRKQLDNIGFCYDWSREVRTSDASYYKWTQWIFLQLFKSWYNRKTAKAESIDELINIFETEGNINHPVPDSKFQLSNLPAGKELESSTFSSADWSSFDEFTQQAILMEYRLAYCGYGEVNWCEALGTVLANDEVINGVSERGGYPVVKKKLRQWYLRITEYADRLQGDLDTLEWSDAMKEMQTNWIGKSSGAEVNFPLASPPAPLLAERGDAKASVSGNFFKTADDNWHILKDFGRENRKSPTPAEDLLWQNIRHNKLGVKVRRQHSIKGYIVDFALLEALLIVEIDGEYHDEAQQKIYDDARTKYLNEFGLRLIRFSNKEVLNNINVVIEKIKAEIQDQKQNSNTTVGLPLLSKEKGLGDEATPAVRVYTTRPDTIFGVDFMVLAPEHELVEQITTAGQKVAVEEYVAYVKSRSERERMAEKKISGCFTGAYAVNPLSGKEIPIWISEYVLAGYGTGAIMAVPSGDERDHKFAQFFNIPITNIFGDAYKGDEAIADKNETLYNSDFITGLKVKEAAEKIIEWLEDNEIGERKVNYKMRDAAFSRQRYWGEPFPIIWKDGIAYPLKESELPLELPHVESYGPGPDGEGPLANMKDWILIPDPSPLVEKGASGAGNVPKYKVQNPIQYELAKNMRKGYTEAEGMLWDLLRGSKTGAKFRRQHPIESYIVDFVSLQDKLIVEVDGGYHETEEQKKYDEERTNVLKEIGFNLIRFSNEEVLKNSYAVRDRIKLELNRLTPSPLVERGQGVRETNTMPGYAGSSWYFLRYMDPQNDTAFCDRKVSDYWNQVDLYIGGTEHAVGHLLYSRMWTKVLYDLGHVGFNEPFKRLVNQGMITGSSRLIYVYRLNAQAVEPGGPKTIHEFNRVLPPIFISKSYHEKILQVGPEEILRLIYQQENIAFDFSEEELTYYAYYLHLTPMRVPVEYVDGIELDLEKMKKYSQKEFREGWYLKENDGKFLCDIEIEKMSKSKLNVINPDDLVNKYGADTFRMYEMFLGPVEQSKPWDTKGIEGVHRFLKKLWRLFYDEQKGQVWNEEQPTAEELKVLHRTIKKIEEDTERFSFNTAVSAFMIAVNELTDLKCSKKSILENILVLLTPYAPHVAEELWHQLGKTDSILDAAYPVFEEKYVVESSKSYPVAINGKTRTEINIALDATQQQVEEIILADDIVLKWLEGKQPKKIIYVKNRMINVVM